MNKKSVFNGYKTGIGRWANLGPYYAMFPYEWAEEMILKHSYPYAKVLDPFVGRGTSLYAAAALGRYSQGVEINPVGWLFAKAKLQPNGVEKILSRLSSLKNSYEKIDISPVKSDAFLNSLFCESVLRFILCAKENLNWKEDHLDGELMAFLLHYLHGHVGYSLSNQMDRARSKAREYSINFWKKNKMDTPPEVDPFDFLRKKIKWRYEKGIPYLAENNVILGDSCNVLDSLKERSYDLLITSPPYIGVADYYQDQWIRLWVLGEQESGKKHPHKGDFSSAQIYKKLIYSVFGKCAKLMKENAKIVVRTDIRTKTLKITLEALGQVFPDHITTMKDDKFLRRGLTEIGGNKSSRKGEVDIVMSPKRVKGRKKIYGHSPRYTRIDDWVYELLKKESEKSEKATTSLINQILSNHYNIPS